MSVTEGMAEAAKAFAEQAKKLARRVSNRSLNSTEVIA
jgi:hypothetical protein